MADVVDELCDIVQVMCLVGRMLLGFVVSSYMEVPTLNEVTEVFTDYYIARSSWSNVL